MQMKPATASIAVTFRKSLECNFRVKVNLEDYLNYHLFRKKKIDYVSRDLGTNP